MNPVCMSRHPEKTNTFCKRHPHHSGDHADLAGSTWSVAPAGSYTRHSAPDYADGGVTAAAIEKETESGGDEWLDARYAAALEQVGGRKAEALDAVTVWMIGATWGREHAEQPRPLTVTDDMVERALAVERRVYDGYTTEPVTMRELLTAALTEPTRPEGAEAVSSVLGALREDDGEWMTYASDKDLDGLADALAERGVRVTGAES